MKSHLPQIYSSSLVDFGVWNSESFERNFFHSWDIYEKTVFTHS